MSTRSTSAGVRACVWLAVLVCLFAGRHAHAIPVCNVSVSSIALLYAGSTENAYGTVELHCTRDSGDGNTLGYRLKADTGLAATAADPYRRVRLDGTTEHLNYIVAIANRAGASAHCKNATNWLAPASGTAGVATDVLKFGAALQASASWNFCVRVRGPQGGANPPAPTPGVYADVFSVFAQYPDDDAGALSSPVPVNVAVAVGSQCLFSRFPASMTFDYPAFSPVPVVVSEGFSLLCSNTLPWTISVTPASATLLDLSYGLSVNPPTGVGTGGVQDVVLTGTIPANQAGTCPAPTCSAVREHTVTISY